MQMKFVDNPAMNLSMILTSTLFASDQDQPVLVRIDNDLAIVWAPFEFLVNGKVDHCGTDLFHLIRQNGKWLIASVADSGRKGLYRKISNRSSYIYCPGLK